MGGVSEGGLPGTSAQTGLGGVQGRLGWRGPSSGENYSEYLGDSHALRVELAFAVLAGVKILTSGHARDLKD